MKKIALSFIVATATIFGANYVVPKKMDDLSNSIRANGELVFDGYDGRNSLENYERTSKLQYNIGINYTCELTKQLKCSDGKYPKLTINNIQVYIKNDKNEAVPLLGYDLKIFKKGEQYRYTKDNQYAVCLAALGGDNWDKISIKKGRTSNSKEVDIDVQLDYQPNHYYKVWVAFARGWSFRPDGKGRVETASRESRAIVSYSLTCPTN